MWTKSGESFSLPWRNVMHINFQTGFQSKSSLCIWGGELKRETSKQNMIQVPKSDPGFLCTIVHGCKQVTLWYITIVSKIY